MKLNILSARQPKAIMQTAHPLERRSTEADHFFQARLLPAGNRPPGHFSGSGVTSSAGQGLIPMTNSLFPAPAQMNSPNNDYLLVAKNGPGGVFVTHKIINLAYPNSSHTYPPFQNYNISQNFHPYPYNNYGSYTIPHFRHFQTDAYNGKLAQNPFSNADRFFEQQEYQKSHNYVSNYTKEESYYSYKDAENKEEVDISPLSLNTLDQRMPSFLSQQSFPLQTRATLDTYYIVNIPDADLRSLKRLLFHYFYTEPDREIVDIPILSEECLCILKVLLTKKLVHDKKKSRVSHRISYITNETLPDFMQQHPPLNRKNITKSNIFKKIWRLLENRRRGNFLEFYFGDLAETQPSEAFSMKAYRKSHNFNLGDRFYTRCLASPEFRADFMETLQQAQFRANTLYAAQQNFDKSFHSWVVEVQRFLKDETASGPGWLGKKQLRARLPEVKFGVSSHDFNLSLELFGKLARRATE